MTVTLSQAHLCRGLAQNHEALYVLSAVHLERTDRSSSPLWGLVLASKRWRVVKNIPFLGLFPPSFQGREGQVSQQGQGNIHSVSSQQQLVLQQQEIRSRFRRSRRLPAKIRDYIYLPENCSSTSSHTNPSLHRRSTLCYWTQTLQCQCSRSFDSERLLFGTAHQAQGCRAQLCPQHQPRNPTRGKRRAKSYWPDGSFSS